MKAHGDKNNLCFKDKTWTSSEEPAFTMKPPIKAHRTHCLSFKVFLIVFCWLLLSCDPQRLHLTASEISFVSLYLFLKIHSSGLGMHSKGAGSASTAFSSENENTSLKRMPWISPNKQETGNYEKYWGGGGEKKSLYAFAGSPQVCNNALQTRVWLLKTTQEDFTDLWKWSRNLKRRWLLIDISISKPGLMQELRCIKIRSDGGVKEIWTSPTSAEVPLQSVPRSKCQTSQQSEPL